MKLIILAIILFTSVIGLGVAYADEFNMPFGADAFVDFWVEVILNPTDDGGTDVRVIQNTLFHYDNILSMPDKFTITLEKQGGGSEKRTVLVKELYQESIALQEPEPESELAESVITPEAQARLDEKRAEEETKFKEALFCKYGVGGSSVFQAKRDVIVLKQIDYFQQLPTNARETVLILATEECRVMQESYLYKYAEYEDIAEAQSTDIIPFELDESDSPYTDPVTARDKADAAETAEQYKCSIAGKQMGLCTDRFTGENRGGYTPGKGCDIRPVVYQEELTFFLII